MRKLPPAVVRWLLVVAVLIAWEAFARLSAVSPILIAPPSAIAARLVAIATDPDAAPDFYMNLAITVGEIVAAYALAVLIGGAVGVAVASSKLIGDAFEPLLLILYAIPKIILYPILVLILGTNEVTKIVFGVTVSVFVIIFNTAAGLRQVEPNYLRLARSLGYTRSQIFFKVQVPAAAPTILAGLRLGFGYTILGVLTGEILIVNAGIGFLIDWATVNYYTPDLYAFIILTLTLGGVANLAIGRLEQRWIHR